MRSRSAAIRRSSAGRRGILALSSARCMDASDWWCGTGQRARCVVADHRAGWPDSVPSGGGNLSGGGRRQRREVDTSKAAAPRQQPRWGDRRKVKGLPGRDASERADDDHDDDHDHQHRGHLVGDAVEALRPRLRSSRNSRRHFAAAHGSRTSAAPSQISRATSRRDQSMMPGVSTSNTPKVQVAIIAGLMICQQPALHHLEALALDRAGRHRNGRRRAAAGRTCRPSRRSTRSCGTPSSRGSNTPGMRSSCRRPSSLGVGHKPQAGGQRRCLGPPFLRGAPARRAQR